MAAVYKAFFQGSQPALELVSSSFGLSFEADENGFWLWGDALEIGPTEGEWRSRLSKFAQKANMIVGLECPAWGPIKSTGSVSIVNGGTTHHVLLAETAHFEVTLHPVILSARGGGAPTPRVLAVRAQELASREPRFKEAASKLAAAREDFRELFKVAELIEKGHGGLPKKRPRGERHTFFDQLQVEESDWEALHRSARPHRHAEEHVDGGPKITAGQARALLHHALKLWLDREVPI
jgi:hypothetical protein